ncbi:MAG: YoaK family protein [Polyangiales bacterium]
MDNLAAPPAEFPRSVSVSLGAVLATAGGFLDSYTYLTRHGVFATSQTGNIVLFGIESAQGEWTRAVRHLPPLLAFIAGVLAAETLKRPGVARLVRWPARAALVIEIAALLVVGALPESTPDAIVTLTIAFVCSVQVTMFRTLLRWQYNTTMTTGNLRSAAQAVYAALADRDAEAALRARAFTIILAAFTGGAILGGACSTWWGVRAAWVAAACLVLGLWLFTADHLPPRHASPPPTAAGGRQ